MVEKNVTTFYTGDAGRAYHQGKRAIPDEAFPWVACLRTEKFSPWIRPSDIVLEYGVGWGWNLAALPCRQKLGYDIAEAVIPKLKERGIQFVADLRKLNEASLDTVICHHTLEHLLEPAAALETMRRLLKPGGRLLIFVPFETEKHYRRFDPQEPNHHLFSWNPQSLGNLLESLNFKVLQAGTGEFGYDRFAAAWAVKLRLGQTGFRLLRKLLHIIRPGREVRLVAESRVVR